MLRSHLRLAVAILSAAFLLPSLTFAQSQDAQSVAEAARRAKEEKKKASAKSKVVTEEDLDAIRAKSRDQTPAPASPASAVAAPPAASAQETAPNPSPNTGAPKKDDPEVAKLKQQLAAEEQSLDLAKREAALARDTYYSNPDYARDTAGKAGLDALQQQITEKQQRVQDLKARLAALELAKPSSSAPGSTPPPSTR
jgi:hypothetical protein